MTHKHLSAIYAILTFVAITLSITSSNPLLLFLAIISAVWSAQYAIIAEIRQLKDE